MIIVGCDFHTRFQQVAMLAPTTGELFLSAVQRFLTSHKTGNPNYVH